MKLDELRSDIEIICNEIISEIEGACNAHQGRTARICREEFWNYVPNYQLVINYINEYAFSWSGADGVKLKMLGARLHEAVYLLAEAERNAFYSLQQEVSLASTGPKRSLDH